MIINLAMSCHVLLLFICVLGCVDVLSSFLYLNYVNEKVYTSVRITSACLIHSLFLYDVLQLFRIVLGSQRQLQTLVLQRNRSFQLILALMIAALLIGKILSLLQN